MKKKITKPIQNKKRKVTTKSSIKDDFSWQKIVFSLFAIAILIFASSSKISKYNKHRSAEDQIALQYIEQYKDLAILEMHRSGIPASITLAQGLHESNSGLSSLATSANNHFGIKCKSYWVGKTFYHKDDDFKNGKLIESCFRAYESAVQSYVDHSNFLMGNKLYSSLFEYDHADYESWAYGLKRCGYATDAKYAQKLIDKIEDYELYIYDFEENPLEVLK
ncbi:MAG TPA: glucosaminidase domain-containing protein [Saprospiraceae bacterium]|nr:glucosaminidase domain-containing protein [Saprospiraceae bacterium]HPN68392.1 glucosaminidase domain-containing protein [Saprospiraceae bacterium]